MLRLLVDTSVWLDWAKDHRQKRFVETLGELVTAGIIEIILPKVVTDEFARNKERVIEESGKSLASAIKRAREAVDQLSNSRRKKTTVLELSDLEHKLKTSNAGATDSINLIEAIFKASTLVATTDDVLLKASKRAVEGKAPFHKQKNSIADAILIEIYAATISGASAEIPCVFVTHNKHDFSAMSVDQRKPHPDITTLFDDFKSFYSINLLETMRSIVPEVVANLAEFEDFTMEPKNLGELIAAEHELFEKIWYNRHIALMYRVSAGKIKTIRDNDWTAKNHNKTITKSVLKGAKKAGARVRKQYGIKNLGPYTDFEWGMLNGKLSAIRWALGDDWDMLDT